VTYRTRAHSEGMRDGSYRTREEVDSWRARDPIKLLRGRILEDRVLSEAELDRVETVVQAETEEAFEFAKNSPWPDPATVLEHIYHE